jgi:hypothetical protein
MAEQELEIEISRDGKVTVRTHGIKGPACMDYADLMVQIIGREDARQKTSEFYESEQSSVQQHIEAKRRR